MTHEPIHTIHLTPHITWQGTRAELEAMQKEGWPLKPNEKHCDCGCIHSEEDCTNCNYQSEKDRIAELERNILAAENRLKLLAKWLDLSDDELNNLPIGSIVDDHRKMQADVNAAIAALKGQADE